VHVVHFNSCIVILTEDIGTSSAEMLRRQRQTRLEVKILVSTQPCNTVLSIERSASFNVTGLQHNSFAIIPPGIEHVLADISRSPLCCHVRRLPIRAALYRQSNETRAPMANPHNSAQLRAPSAIPTSYIRARAAVWECGRGQTHRHTDARFHYTIR